MQAIILAAGMGKRLGELTKDSTKCMVKVAGVTLIERLLNQLEKFNLSRIVVVDGYQGKKLEDFINSLNIQTPIEYVENKVYDKTNNIYSLYLASNYLEKEDTLLFESDIIMEDSIIEQLINNPYDNLAVVAKYENWMDGTVLSIDSDLKIRQFYSSKEMDSTVLHKYYKTVNVYKFSKDFAKNMYVPFLATYCKILGKNEYYEQVLKVLTFIDNSGLKVLPLKDEKWYEIDDIQDLDIAESLFSKDSYHKIAGRYGGYWRYPKMLDYCYLVNPYFPNEKLVNELSASFHELLITYPSGKGINDLLASRYFEVKQEHIVLGNGAAELINELTKYIEGKVGIVRPTFEEYPNRLDKDRLVVYYTHEENDFRYTAQNLIDYFADKDIKNLIFINPDNPSGNYLNRQDTQKLVEWTEQAGIRLVIDESFIDFSTEKITYLNNDFIDRHKHVVIIKSISKSFGVPGLRLGVMASSDIELIEHIRHSSPIWNINSFAEYYMQIMLKYKKAYEQAMDRFRAERERFVKDLNSIGFLRVLPSEANYVLCQITKQFTSEQLCNLLLKEKNILIKDCKGKCEGEYIRLAIRDDKDNDKLIETLKHYAN
ncbi:MAG: aminotransferase class I/II-fold pyridoxal phosphate-dependent enzyme [Paludibacteraceae bacterium]|nr:aminotransferase class I/II-fold pyridoxal phosphate-dependent enzyme [Paludibacteraceae bacterium]